MEGIATVSHLESGPKPWWGQNTETRMEKETEANLLDILKRKERAEKKSFADILKGISREGDVAIRQPTRIQNLPGIIFTEEEEQKLSEHLHHALIGKFSKGSPSFQMIKPELMKLGLKGHFTVGALKPGYVVINPNLEEDYTRLWTKREWVIGGKVMRLFKWTPSFCYSKESPSAPVWVSFPDLPMHLFAKGALYSIASILGTPVNIDDPTAN